MNTGSDLISKLSQQYQDRFAHQKVIISYARFLELVKANPRRMIRSAADYVKATIDHFGTRSPEDPTARVRFKLFDIKTEKSGPIVGGELVQEEIYRIVSDFCRQGFANKLAMLHGPNGSAKTSTIEALACGMQRFSETDEGAVYRFNWIFPTDRTALPKVKGESGPIGFSSKSDSSNGEDGTYALLDDTQIACKIQSDFKDNPIYLIPMPQREVWLREWLAAAEGTTPDKVEIPPHILQSGLSKRNQLILENLIAVYEGNLARALRHVQVERFFYSKQYRIGIATVEPQMSIDANERMLTMDSNLQNLPSFLQNIRFHEASGELVEANRGILEFSDLLKRPLETFKYLLNTVERQTLNLPSSTANLDIVFFATSNEKHLDAFKTVPDFSSFRSRFELVTVPYLLMPTQEARIYDADVQSLKKLKQISPHAVELLCVWATMTRLKQPDPEFYPSNVRSLVSRLDPRNKIRLFERHSLQPWFKASEEQVLREIRDDIWNESVGMVVYEGRFGASPREIRGILNRASQNHQHPELTTMAIFDELERIVKDRTVYEFLQFEPRGKYHDAALFIEVIKDEFADIFAQEIQTAMALVEEGEYEKLLARYIDHVVAFVKREKIFNPASESYEAPSEAMMKEVEQIIGVQGAADRHREGLLAKIASWKLENRDKPVQINFIFENILRKIQDHYHERKSTVVTANYRAMLMLDTDDARNLKDAETKTAELTYSNLEKMFGYTRTMARKSLTFLLAHQKEKGK